MSQNAVRYNVGTIQCNYEIIKCEKNIMLPPNVTKVQLDVVRVLPNVTIE